MLLKCKMYAFKIVKTFQMYCRFVASKMHCQNKRKKLTFKKHAIYW